MITITNTNLSLSQICDSGQCFRMTPLEDGSFEIIADDKYLLASQDGDQIYFDCSQEEFDVFWSSYFDLATDYSAYISRINPNDRYLTEAAAFGWGVRILRQDLWEMIATFLISQQNNIKRIRRCINLISEQYGRRCETSDGKVYYAFPKPEALADLEDHALMACNLGYRSKYVVRTARAIVNGEIDLELIEKLPYIKARAELLKCYGVGEKVADCICLFALHHLQAFPVDTHIRQVLDQHYKRGFPNRRYKDCRGVMQQYIFYYDLKGNTKEE